MTCFFPFHRGELRIQSHITVLHVEQEVIGDDTLALDSVLECDELRESLLKEEKQLNEKLHATRLVMQFVYHLKIFWYLLFFKYLQGLVLCFNMWSWTLVGMLDPNHILIFAVTPINSLAGSQFVHQSWIRPTYQEVIRYALNQK